MRSAQIDFEGEPASTSTMSERDPGSPTPAARTVDLTKAYGTGEGVVRALAAAATGTADRKPIPASLAGGGSPSARRRRCGPVRRRLRPVRLRSERDRRRRIGAGILV